MLIYFNSYGGVSRLGMRFSDSVGVLLTDEFFMGRTVGDNDICYLNPIGDRVYIDQLGRLLMETEYDYVGGSANRSSHISYYYGGPIMRVGGASFEYYSNGSCMRVNGVGIQFYSDGRLMRAGNAVVDYYSNGRVMRAGNSGSIEYYSDGRIMRIGSMGFEYYGDGRIMRIGSISF